MTEARRAAESAARTSYGRLLALTARRTRDIGAAEDALADAFRAGLEQWPESGVPDNPEAWLLTVARRASGHAYTRATRAEQAQATLMLLDEESTATPAPIFADKRLELMFVCAHPAIEPAMHTPLMLQIVLGLDAARIAAAFVTAPAAIGQRLVRAKTKIRDAGIAFDIPDPEAIEDRLAAVLSAIYAAYGTGWDDVIGADPKRRGLTSEALFLARLVVDLCPQEPEPRGLLALMLYCEARSTARRSADGSFVPLDRQDIGLWSAPMIAEAEQQLRTAATAARYGRFQTEAAIQSLHIGARLTGLPHHAALAQLYDLLAARDPAIGVLVARAVAHGAIDAVVGLGLLEALPEARVAAYQPFWAARAHLERQAGRDDSAARDRAIGLSSDPAVRAFLAVQH